MVIKPPHQAWTAAVVAVDGSPYSVKLVASRHTR